MGKNEKDTGIDDNTIYAVLKDDGTGETTND